MGKFNYFETNRKRLEKISPKSQEDLIFDLINAFSLLRTPVNTTLFLRDLLTEDEVKILAKRLRIAKLLMAGQKNEEIVRELHCSFATVTKVRMWLGNAGQGLRSVISKLPSRREIYRAKRNPGIGYGLPDILLALGSEYLVSREKKQLSKFAESMRVKADDYKSLRENLNAQFANRVKKKL